MPAVYKKVINGKTQPVIATFAAREQYKMKILCCLDIYNLKRSGAARHL